MSSRVVGFCLAVASSVGSVGCASYYVADAGGVAFSRTNGEICAVPADEPRAGNRAAAGRARLVAELLHHACELRANGHQSEGDALQSTAVQLAMAERVAEHDTESIRLATRALEVAEDRLLETACTDADRHVAEVAEQSLREVQAAAKEKRDLQAVLSRETAAIFRAKETRRAACEAWVSKLRGGIEEAKKLLARP